MYTSSVTRNKVWATGRARLSLFLLLYLLLISLPFDIFPILSLGARGVKPIWFTGFFFVIVFLLHVFSGEQTIRKNTIGNFILAFNIIALFSLINLVNGSKAQLMDFFTLWFRLPLFTLIFFAITSLNLTDIQIKKVLRFWIGIAFVLSIYAIYQVFARMFELPFAYISILNPSLRPHEFAVTRGGAFGSFIRPSSVFAEPSFFGNYLVSPLLLMGILWLYRKDIGNFLFQSTIANSIVFTTIVAGFLLTFAMGTYITLTLTILVAFFNKKLSKKILRFAVIILILLVIIGFALEPFLDVNFMEIVAIRALAHILEIANPIDFDLQSPYAKNSVSIRLERAGTAFAVWLENPITGVGLNNFGYYYPSGVARRIHSGFIQSLVEMGIFGLLGFLAIFVITLTTIRRHIHRIAANNPAKIILTAFYCIIWAKLFGLLMSQGWANEGFWIDLSVAVLVLYWSESSEKRKGGEYRLGS